MWARRPEAASASAPRRPPVLRSARDQTPIRRQRIAEARRRAILDRRRGGSSEGAGKAVKQRLKGLAALDAQLTEQPALRSLPMRGQATYLRFPSRREPQQAFAAIVSTSSCDQSSADQWSETARERRAVQGEHLAEPPLGDLGGEAQHLQESELRGAESGGAEFAVVERRQRTIGAPQGGARAGQLWKSVARRLLGHGEMWIPRYCEPLKRKLGSVTVRALAPQRE
jgi:hypothetical protein